MVNIHFSIKDFYNEFKKQLVNDPDPVNALERTINSLGKDYILPVTEVILSGFPLMSQQASGRFRDYIFVTRNGETYIKPYKKPRNPNSPKQIAQRQKFEWVTKSWKDLSPEIKQDYLKRAKQLPKPMNGISLYCQEQLNQK